MQCSAVHCIALQSPPDPRSQPTSLESLAALEKDWETLQLERELEELSRQIQQVWKHLYIGGEITGELNLFF